MTKTLAMMENMAMEVLALLRLKSVFGLFLAFFCTVRSSLYFLCIPINSDEIKIFMEQELIFGLDLGRLAIPKKNCADYEQLLRPVFHVFMGKKN